MGTTENFTATTDGTYDEYEYSTTTPEYIYDYSSDSPSEECNKTSPMQFGAIFIPVFFSIMVILSLFGNILVIVILTKFENLKSLTNAFILNLAISDLFFTVGLPFWAYYHMHEWSLGDAACKIVNFVFYVGFYSSGILLILMTIHRYIAVMNPLSNIVSLEGFCSILASVVIWVVSVLVALPASIYTEVQDPGYCGFGSSKWTLWGIYQQNAIFIVSSVVFIFCYCQIICRLLRPTAQRRKNKTLKLIFILMVVFFVGWAPYNIVIFLQSFDYWPKEAADSATLAANCETSVRLDYALYVARIFAFSHCCLNPVFYVFVGVKFKTHLKKLLKGWSHEENNSIRNRQSRVTLMSMTSEMSV